MTTPSTSADFKLAGYETIRPTCSKKKTNGLWKQNSRAERQKTAEGKMILFRSPLILPIMKAQNYKLLLNFAFFLDHLLLRDYNSFSVFGIG
jgi:hypothetical protein